MIYNREAEKQKQNFYIEDVLDREHAGWLEGLTQDGIKVPLCYKTKVTLLDETGKAQNIKVEEGEHKGTILSIPFRYRDKDAAVSYLSKNREKNKRSLILHKTKNTLEIITIGMFKVEISPDIISGIYKLQIPTRPIKKPLNPDYYNENVGGSRFVETWFRLTPTKGVLKDVFLHYGSYSKGCIAVINNKEFSVWNKIYLILMESRLDDNYVATLLVK